jgi:hypothetical protein
MLASLPKPSAAETSPSAPATSSTSTEDSTCADSDFMIKNDTTLTPKSLEASAKKVF